MCGFHLIEPQALALLPTLLVLRIIHESLTLTKYGAIPAKEPEYPHTYQVTRMVEPLD
jgi:hypothetical protein